MPKSTLAEANEKKDWRIYQDFGYVLIQKAKKLYEGEKLRIDLDEMVCAFDSSTIELCLALCPWATLHHGKCGCKMHTLMDLKESIPIFILNATYLRWDDTTYRILHFSEVSCDNLRLVVYEDFSDGKVYRFLTNNFSIDAITVAELYRERWQIEIFFKWIKQHLHIKTFYGTTRNAVYTQIWIAICDSLLLIIAKKQYGLKPSLHTISNSIGQILFKRGDIRDFYNKPDEPINVPEDDSNRQLTLW